MEAITNLKESRKYLLVVYLTDAEVLVFSEDSIQKIDKVLQEIKGAEIIGVLGYRVYKSHTQFLNMGVANGLKRRPKHSDTKRTTCR